MICKIIPFLLSKVISTRLKFKYKTIGKGIRIVKLREFNAPVGMINIGDDFFAGTGLYVSLSQYSALEIGDAVMFGPDVMILGGNHDYRCNECHLRYYKQEDKDAKDIVIESGVWVGARVIFLSGGHTSEGAVIGAGSLVNKYIPPYSIATGSPAHADKCRFINVEELREALINMNSRYSVEQILEIYEKYGVKLQ